MSNYKAKVHVRLKSSVLDPQGKAIEHALSALGFAEAKNVRAGKFFEFDIEAENQQTAEKRAGEMAHTLLANPVIEDYSLSVDRAHP